MARVEAIDDIIGYHFNRKELRNEAFLAAGASVSQKAVQGPVEGNKRLALVGDAVWRLVLLDQWYPRGSDTGEGSSYPFVLLLQGIEEGDAITRRHGSNRKMKEIAEAWGLQKFITENPCQDHPMPRTLASTVEAIVGAVWFDSEKNFEAVRNVMEHLQSD
jgi:ribonuclease-3